MAPIVSRAFGDGALFADQHLDSQAHMMATYTLVLTEQFGLAEREMARAIDHADRRGSASVSIALLFRALARLQLGCLADAEAAL